MKRKKICLRSLLVFCIAIISLNAKAQKNILPKVLFNAEPVRNAVKISPRFEAKNKNDQKMDDSTNIIVKDKNGKEKKIPIGTYNKAMTDFQNYLNRKGYTLEELEKSRAPIVSNNIANKTDFLNADKTKFASVVNSNVINKPIKPSFFNRKSLVGLNIDFIPAHMLKKATVKSFRTINNKKIIYNTTKREYVILETPLIILAPSVNTTNPRINHRVKEIPFLNIGDNTDLALSVNVIGTLEAKATAYPINKDAEDVTLADIEATNSTYEVKASIGANGKIGNANINVFNLNTSYTANAKANIKHRNNIELIVGGQTIANIPTEYADKTTTVTNSFSKEVDIPVVGCRVYILIGYIEFEAGIRGQVGFTVDGEMTPSSAALLIEPTAQCGLYARTSIGSLFDVPLIIPDYIVTFEPFVQANLNFVDMSLTNYAEASLNWGQDWILNADCSSTGTVKLLTGDLNAGVKISYPSFNFSDGIHQVNQIFQTNIWQSAGLRQYDKTFISPKDQPTVFATW
jgi:hypothetical protein